MKPKSFLKILLVLVALFVQVGWAQINDNFNDNFLDPRLWNVLTPSPGTSATVSETNQRLEVTLGSGFGGAGIVTVCQFPGDFDVQVDYILLNWPATNLHSVRLGAPDLGVGSGGGIGLNRSSFPNGGTGEFYLLSLPNSAPQVATTQLSGKLRLVRTGSTLSGFIMAGTTWVLVGSGPVSTASTHISLDLGGGSSNAPGGISAAFDNFQVNSGTVICPGASACQVSVTRESQGNPLWKNNPYDHSTLFTIGEKGCALTSLSMALNFAGVANDPGTLNQFMTDTDKDYVGLDVWWGPATRDAAGPLSPFSPPKQLRFDILAGWMDSRTDSITNPTGAFKELNDALCSATPHPVVVGVRGINNSCVPVGSFPVGGSPGHYVLVTGRQVDSAGKVTYLIADPACASHTTLDAYGNEFSTRGIVTDPPGDISELDLALDDAAEILVTDQIGNRTGFDPITGATVQDISNSAYFRDALNNDETGDPPTETGHFVQIFRPMQGTYGISVAGLKLGAYTLSVRSFSQDGSTQPETALSGIAGTGSISTLQLQFASSPGSTPTLVVLATFRSTLADIDNSLQLGLLDNRGIAESLLQKIRAAANASAQGQNQTKVNSLNAFKSEINAQSGKHITGIAVQVLLQDADSLLNR